ncbi:LysE family translocator [Lutibaculum baratangense]|uniref:Homoserine/homoserine lactone efflux protein n=1 Tax=Lutibaculum baratangense AMV1 TaxID=631454 RepID=V4RBZ3_9HYPH|nr:LysE family translocator [Lutibaculum baratangense]ESR23686.1 Homoserine/homoserine lactone efflux protein [Lutibaculum baratangense AMV1]
MSFESWLAFVAASTVLMLIPGPTVMMLVGYGLARGRRSVLFAMPGVALGNLVCILGALLGLGALLATSAVLFTILKWVGAAYLLWLGIKLWRERPGGFEAEAVDAHDGRRMFVHAFAVTALNPKTIAFFLAFLPQFIDRGAPFAPQVVVLAATFVAMSAVFDTTYGLAAGSARELVGRRGLRRLANRIGGTALIGASVATVTLRHN